MLIAEDGNPHWDKEWFRDDSTEEQIQNTRNFITFLREGLHLQCRNRYRQHDYPGSEAKYCAMGLAMRLFLDPDLESYGISENQAVRNLTGITPEGAAGIVYSNDWEKLSFSQIADLVEWKLEEWLRNEKLRKLNNTDPPANPPS